MEQNENTLSVLKIAPGQYPQQVEIDNDLKALQQAVGHLHSFFHDVFINRAVKACFEALLQFGFA